MNRRELLKTLLLATTSGGVYSKLSAMDATSLDKYGGWTGKIFEATGFFRVEKDDRWWIVSPEGNAFLSFGINHLHLNWFKQDYQREHIQKVLGISNVHNKEEFWPALRTWFLKTCNEFGFNTVGVHNDPLDEMINFPNPGLPYMQPLRFADISHYKQVLPDENFVDIFSNDYARHCDQMAKKIAGAKKDDPYLVGYTMSDCPLFTEEDCRERADTIGGERRGARIGWPRRLRNLGGDAPGKKAYVKLMHKLYRGEINWFNETYGTGFNSFDKLEAAKNWRPNTDLSNGNETRDNVEFLKLCVDKYYQVAVDSIRKYDTNHMFIGDKLHANTDTVDTVLPVTSKYTDIIMYQMYAQYNIQKIGLDRWSAQVDKPFLNGDASYAMAMEDITWAFGPIAHSMEQRIEWVKEFFENAFARPEFVGWHYCGLIDTTTKNAKKIERQHAGVVNQYGVPYPELQKCIKQLSKNMYDIASKGQKI